MEIKKVKDEIYKFLKDALENYANMENHPFFIYPTFYHHNFRFYEVMRMLREEGNRENIKIKI